MEKPENYETLIRSYINPFKYEVGNAFDLFKYRFAKRMENPHADVYELLVKNNRMYMYESLALGLNALIYFESQQWTYPLPYFNDINPGDVIYNSYVKKEYTCILGTDFGSPIAGLFLLDNKLEYSTIYNYDKVWSIKTKTDHNTRGPVWYVEGAKQDPAEFVLQPFIYSD